MKKKNKMGVILPIVFFFLNTTAFPQMQNSTPAPDSEKIIYLVKIRWHTGIIFEYSQIDTAVWKFIDDFKKFDYVDVGWGDEEFYQAPGFDLDLAVRALFTETNSTLRVAGFNRSLDEYLKSTDYAERIILTDGKYKRLCEYIQSAYKLIENHPVILSEHFGGAVVFYKAVGYYNMFNTCNTWIAKALKFAGYKVNDEIILAEQLFREAVKFGTMVKIPED